MRRLGRADRAPELPRNGGVLAATQGIPTGALAGTYAGVGAQATAGVGVGANVLVGGTSGSIHLQTISVQGQLGLNAAATGTSMTLNSVG